MKQKSGLVFLVMLAAGLWLLTACGSKPAAMTDIPVYPQAIELKPGESEVDEVLANNIKDDAVMRKVMEPVASGGRLEQKSFELPEGTKWENILDFYQENLTQAGWSIGFGGVPRQVADVATVLDDSDQGSKPFQATLFIKGKQYLGIVMVTPFPDENYQELQLSLVTE